MGSGVMVQLVFLSMAMNMLSIAVDEELLILVGKSAILYSSYDANRVIQVCYLCYLGNWCLYHHI